MDLQKCQYVGIYRETMQMKKVFEDPLAEQFSNLKHTGSGTVVEDFDLTQIVLKIIRIR